MTSDARDQPRLTPKGERTQARIVDAAARLIHQQSVAGTTLDDVKATAGVSGSQLYHYFPDKDDLVQAVIDRQAATIAGSQRQADLGSPDGLRAWRDTVIAQARRTGGTGGCPLGSLAGQLAETDPGPAPGSPPDSSSGRPQSATTCERSTSPGTSRPSIDPTTAPSPCSPRCRAASCSPRSSRTFVRLETAVDTFLALIARGEPGQRVRPRRVRVNSGEPGTDAY